MERIKAFIAWVVQTKPVRVVQRYGADRGPILASGLANQAIFAIFAAIWAVFSIAALVIAGDTVLRQRLIDTIASAVPGLIERGAGDGGAIDPAVLLESQTFSITLVLSLLGLLVTALGFLASLRDGIRVLFGLPPLGGNPVLQKVKDLAIGIGFAVVLLLSGALSFFGTSATDWLLDAIGIGSDSVVGAVFTRILTIAIMFAIDAVTLGVLYRVLSGAAIPWARMRGGVLIGAAGLGVLKLLFSAALIGGVSSNPLLQSFAVILGLLIFFNFVCQVILIAAAWIAIGFDDRGLDIDPAVAAQRVSAARELLSRHGYASGRPVERRGIGGRRFVRIARED